MYSDVESGIDIAAPAERVWQVLTAFAAYPEWNPYIVSISGRLRRRGRLDVVLAPPLSPPLRFHPRINRLEPGCCIGWVGTLLVEGVLDVEQLIRVTAVDRAHSRLEQHGHMNGFLVPMLGHPFRLSVRRGFEAMNQALKSRVEAPADQPTP